MSGPERVVENLNRALHAAMGRDERLYLLGEDLADPYGGAFKVTRGLSTAYPDRVLSTPLSEGAIVGVAGGLALAGDRAIAEIMFGDFAALAFDQVVNFAAKSASMYGRPLPMRLVVRCPSGGYRGYGPTHSQSLQKHFVGVPGLSLFEISPFHDNGPLLDHMLSLGEACVLFENKVLYGRRTGLGTEHADLFRTGFLDDDRLVAEVGPRDSDDVDCLVVAPGGMTDHVLAAMRALLLDHEINCRLVVPARLYPFDPGPLLPLAERAGAVCVVEEGTAGGTWGAEVAHEIHRRVWRSLRGPVRLVHSADSIIPAAPHLEREILVQPEDIRLAVLGATAEQERVP